MSGDLVAEMINAASQSCADMRSRIGSVAYGPIDGGRETVTFTIDGIPHVGTLRGRNVDLLIGFGAENDASVALRTLLDGDAMELQTA